MKKILWGFGILALLWMFAPYILGMDAIQSHKWASASPWSAVDVLDDWYMDKMHTGRVTITRGDGSKTTYTSKDGTWGDAGAPPEQTTFTIPHHFGYWATVYDKAGHAIATGELTEDAVYNAAGNRWTVVIRGDIFENIPDERVSFFYIDE